MIIIILFYGKFVVYQIVNPQNRLMFALRTFKSAILDMEKQNLKKFYNVFINIDHPKS